MRFEAPWAFLLLLLAPAVLWSAYRARARPALTLPTLAPLVGMRPTWRVRAARALPVCRAGAVALLAVALARPQHGSGRVETSTDAVAIQLVVDRSGSMGQGMDFDGQESTRIDTVKRVLRSFILGDGRELKGRRADLLGLVTFARYAETVCPLVQDADAVAELTGRVQVAGNRNEDGTAIGDALALAAAHLKRAEEQIGARSGGGAGAGGGAPATGASGLSIKSKVVILLTDGANNFGERAPLEAAALAAGWGIKVYTIGIGVGRSYRVVHTPFGDQRVAVDSDADEPTLKKIAEATGGVYRRADDAAALRSIYAEIDRLEKSTVRTVSYTDYAERFAPFAWSAAALAAAELALSATLLRRAP